MKLSNWVKSVGGVEKAAKLIGIKEPRLTGWLHGHSCPHGLMMKRIFLKSKKRVGFIEMVDETTRKSVRGRK